MLLCKWFPTKFKKSSITCPHYLVQVKENFENVGKKESFTQCVIGRAPLIEEANLNSDAVQLSVNVRWRPAYSLHLWSCSTFEAILTTHRIHTTQTYILFHDYPWFMHLLKLSFLILFQIKFSLHSDGWDWKRVCFHTTVEINDLVPSKKYIAWKDMQLSSYRSWSGNTFCCPRNRKFTSFSWIMKMKYFSSTGII